MIKVTTIENVSHIQKSNKCILIGINSNAKIGSLVSHGDKIIKYSKGVVVEEFNLRYVSFIPYGEGILYYEKEGEPIIYTNFSQKKQITPKNHFFSSLQLRSNNEVVLITEMDESFNQSFYLYSNRMERKLLPKFSNLLLNDSFICTTKNTVELFNSDTLNMCWRYKCDEGLQLDRRNKIFSDGSFLYVPLKGGLLIALDILTGKVKWKWQGEPDYVSYGEVGSFIYVHVGDKIIIVSKVSGQIENEIDYCDYKELDSFRSNGIIWCFDNLIVVRNSGSGEVVLFSRETFELLGRETVDESGIGESKDRIQLLGDYLYILGTSSTAHIYNLKKVSIT